MKFFTLALLAALVACVPPARGQQPSPPGEQALGQKLLVEIQAGLQCSTALITAQAELTKLRAELEAAKKPPEPKKP